MAAINSIIFDMTNNMNITKDIQQAIIQGQKNNIKIRLYFENEPFNYAWDINNVFTRPDGSKSNNIPAIAKDGYFELTLRSWMTDIHGELKIATRIFISGEEYMAFDSVTLLVQESETPSGDTITETQYDAILGAVASKATQAEMDDTTGRVGDLDEDKLNRDGSQAMLGDLDMDGNKLKNAKIDNGVADDDPVNKRQLDEKVPESQLDYDKNANTVPVRNASGNFKVGIAIYTDEAVNKGVLDGAILSHKAANNTFTGNNIFTNVVKIPDGVAAGDAVNKGQLDEKVDKTITIVDLPLSDNIGMNELVNGLREATGAAKGLMSKQDKDKLDQLYALLTDNPDDVINTLSEVFAILENYPEGVNLAQILDDLRDNKVDANAPITAGTYPVITYDDKGLILSGRALSKTDIPKIDTSQINDFDIEIAGKLEDFRETIEEENEFLKIVDVRNNDEYQFKIYIDAEGDLAYDLEEVIL